MSCNINGNKFIMKILYTVLLSTLVLFSCTDSKEENNEPDVNKKNEVSKTGSDEMTEEDKLSNRWVLVNRRNESGEKSRDFEKQPTSIVTYFEDNGYFRVYDSITKAKNEEGVQKIEQRNSGQWEIDSDGLLVLRYTKPDTVITEHFDIEQLDKNILIIKSKEKDLISKYERKF